MTSRDPERGGPLQAVGAALRGSLWPIPVLAIVVAVGLGIGLPALDRRLQEGTGGQPLAFAFGGGPSAAHQVLSAISTSLISVTALVFSLTVVALQLSSSQYTPRLLQTFVTDRTVQFTLAQLVLTFVYALTVMRTVTSSDQATGTRAFVPGSAITLAYLLTLGSVTAVVLFLGHLARSLRVETMLRAVHEEATETLRRQRSAGAGDGGGDRPPELPGPPTLLPAPGSGFLVAVDEELLIRAARECDAVLVLVPRIGDGVVEGTPVARARPARAGAGVDDERLGEALGRGLVLRFERQASRDVVYSLRKLVDIAVRAISPGINDPTTAVHALSHVSAVLCDLLDVPRSARLHRDEDDDVRLVVPEWRPVELLHLALEEPLQFASGQPAVLRRIAGLLREVAWRAPRGTVDDELVRLAGRLAEIARDSTDVSQEERQDWQDRVQAAFEGRWPVAR